jgi:hypothetical protein
MAANSDVIGSSSPFPPGVDLLEHDVMALDTTAINSDAGTALRLTGAISPPLG